MAGDRSPHRRADAARVFYAALGFVAIGPPYLEDGIDHTEMLRPAAADRAPSRPPPI
jgi:hypothetical protein